MRYFQQNVLVSEDGRKTIIERLYSTGEVEYWSVMNMGFQNNGQSGNAQIPFKIEAEGREEAFDNFESAFEFAKPIAESNVKREVEKQAQRERTRILLAGAVPPNMLGTG